MVYLLHPLMYAHLSSITNTPHRRCRRYRKPGGRTGPDPPRRYGGALKRRSTLTYSVLIAIYSADAVLTSAMKLQLALCAVISGKILCILSGVAVLSFICSQWRQRRIVWPSPTRPYPVRSRPPAQVDATRYLQNALLVPHLLHLPPPPPPFLQSRLPGNESTMRSRKNAPRRRSVVRKVESPPSPIF